MPTVFVVHPMDIDISEAEKFGSFEFINHRYIYADEVAHNDGNIPKQFRLNMEHHAMAFDPVSDYLLVAGDHLQLLAMTAILSQIHNKFKALRYDREAKGYVPVNI